MDMINWTISITKFDKASLKRFLWFVNPFVIFSRGAVIALVLSECLPPILVILYIRVRNIHRLTWGGWSFESLNEWGQFLKLALPGVIMLCLEWWSAEVTTFIAGTISEEELAANSVWFQTMVIFYMVIFYKYTCCLLQPPFSTISTLPCPTIPLPLTNFGEVTDGREI